MVPDQIRKILQEYKDIVYTKLYPDREANFDYLPKTLIFAASDNHAKKVVEIAKEVFNRTDDQFVQRITYSAEDSNGLIKSFRTDTDFRIAVTVTLVATGTDVKPLEVLIFLNDVRSETLYTQMKGRGVRTISPDQLRNVTPNANRKDLFYLIDAVGVTESEKIVPGVGGGDYEVNPSLEVLLERMSHGYVPDDHIDILAGKLSAIGNRGDQEEVEKFREMAGFWPQEFAGDLYKALSKGNLPPFTDINAENKERMRLLSPLLENIEARKKIIEIARGYFKTLNDTKDVIESSGFSHEEAQKSTEAFEQYVLSHHDEILALQLIYTGQANKLTSDNLRDLTRQLSEALPFFNVVRQWNDYFLIRPKSVRKLSQVDADALTNLIQLVRFAYGQIEELCSLPSLAAQRFELWCGQKQNELPLTPEQKEVFRNVAKYIVSNGAYSFSSLRRLDHNLANRLIRFFGNAAAANDPILSLNAFMI